MKIQRMISLLLVFIIVAALASGCARTPGETQNHAQDNPETRIENLDIPELWKQELQHAIALGLPADKLEQDNISGAEMMELLDCFVEYADISKLELWKTQQPLLRDSNEVLSRFDAMAAMYLAADTVGGEYAGHNYRLSSLTHGINHSWYVDYLSWDLFGGFDSLGLYNCGEYGEGRLDGAAYYYNLGRASNFSGEYPFPLDPESKSFTFYEPPSYIDAMLAIVRLISSADPALFAPESTAVELEFLDAADKRRVEILDSADALSYSDTGTVYYVSERGSDYNDGLSPETAWATPQHALSRNLRPGDILLLERGGSWYIEPGDRWGLSYSALWIPNGVSLGAYGSGEKPILRGDMKEADNADFWELYHEQDGIKIWKAGESLRYCPVIVFNDGECWATPIMPGMDKSGQYLADDGSAFDVCTALCKDLQFCCILNIDELGIETDIENSPDARGQLYLRCDSGNPAELYNSIHIPQTSAGLNLKSNVKLENISLRYFSCAGALMDGYDGDRSRSVSNCEVAWCGGLLKNYQDNGKGLYLPWAAGGALQCSSSDVSVINSYIHNCAPFALIIALHNNPDNPSACTLNYENMYFADNLLEFCGSGIHMGDYASADIPGTKGYITELVFESNHVMYSGMGWAGKMTGRYDGGGSPFLSAFENMQSAVDNSGIYIRNNIFYKSGFAMFALSDSNLNGDRVNAQPVFSGNSYVCTANKPLLQKNWGSELYYPSEDTMTGILGDKDGSLIVIGK